MVRFITATRLCSSHILLMQTLEVSPGCGTSGHCHYYCAGQSHSRTKNIVAIWTLAGIRGKVKEVAGKVSDNPELEAEGTDEKIAGKVQEKIGQVKKVLGK